MGKAAGTKRRLRKRGKFAYYKDTKRLAAAQKKKVNPVIDCSTVKAAWNENKTVTSNITDMGLILNLSKFPKNPSSVETKNIINPEVVKKLEAEASIKQQNFRLPKEQVRWITGMIDKYGEDYKAMARDSKNYMQETWKQIRVKINKFKNVPEQYAAYLRERSLLTPAADSKDNI